MKTLWRWFSFKTVCCWCEPAHRLSGAPWAWRVSHGCCAEGKEQRLIKIEHELKIRREILKRHLGIPT